VGFQARTSRYGGYVVAMELPPERTSFVGRTTELGEISQALDVRARLLTLLGAPGVGKTRLALRHAAAHAREGGTVWFCDLTEAHDEPAIVSALAQAVDVQLRRSRKSDAARELAARLAELGPALLVLDNVEQIAAQTAKLVARWLDELPELSWLVTSRQRLGVEGEVVLDIAPLPVPDAARLFKDRADAVRGGREADGEEADVIALVERLDGIPLAVELAAARTRALSPAALLKRLGERLAPLDSQRGAPFLGTLERAIGLSWSMLDDAERSALARVSVFHGGFDVEAAEAVLGDEAIELLESLADRSLVYVQAQARGGLRYRVFESIRAFASARLDDSGEREAAEARHAAHYLDDGASPADAPLDEARRAWLHAERDNLFAVLRRSERLKRAADVVGAAERLHALLLLHGPLSSHAALVDSAVTAASAADDEGLLARARLLRGELALLTGPRASAEEDVDAVRAWAAEQNDALLEARALQGAAQLAARAGAADDARDAATRAHRLLKTAGRDDLAAWVQLDLAAATALSDKHDEARIYARGALLAAEQDGDRYLQAASLAQLGSLAARDGDSHAARGWWDRSRELWRELKAVARQGTVEVKLGRLAWEEGRLDDADELLAEAGARLRRTLGPGPATAEAICLRAAIALEHGETALALERAGDAAATIDGANDPIEGFVHGLRGALLASRGDVDEAQSAFDLARGALERGARRSVRGAVDVFEAALFSARDDADKARARLAEHADATKGRVQAARRLVERLLARAQADNPPAGFVLASDGSWLRLPDGARVDLSRRRVLRRLLCELARRRVEAPGALVSSSELVVAGWPGERMLEKSAQDRLWVAVRSLRRLGLEGVLVTGREGYLLDPEVPLALQDSES
jgi:predicted ATPase